MRTWRRTCGPQEGYLLPATLRLLAGSVDGTIKIWKLALLRPPLPVPDWLPDLAESLAGRRIGVRDAPESVPGDSFPRVKERIAQTREQEDYYARWARRSSVSRKFHRPAKDIIMAHKPHNHRIPKATPSHNCGSGRNLLRPERRFLPSRVTGCPDR